MGKESEERIELQIKLAQGRLKRRKTTSIWECWNLEKWTRKLMTKHKPLQQRDDIYRLLIIFNSTSNSITVFKYLSLTGGLGACSCSKMCS